MIIKKVYAKSILDSRGEETILIILKTKKGKFKTSSPSGKSTGKHEVKTYARDLGGDIHFINKLNVEEINKLNISKFDDLIKIEKLVGKNIGGNTLFCLEACILKALAKENKRELWEFLGGKNIRMDIRPVGNAIGGGVHSKGIEGKRPDFQEFLFIGNGNTFEESVGINSRAYKIAGKLLKAKKRNDEGAWEVGISNENVLEIMSEVRELIKNNFREKVSLGVDVASSSFYDGKYNYKNPKENLSKKQQIEKLVDLINKNDILYIEDGLDEEDFLGFRELKSKSGRLIVGDDLTTTNPERLSKAIRLRSINGIIVKPNQIGSLLKVKEVMDIAKKAKIRTIISHRSGETKDNTIADLAVGFGADFIKTGIYGKVRRSKLKRLIKIERRWRRI